MKITLKACRANIGMTAKAVGKIIGVTEDTIYKWERGASAPTAPQMVKMLDLYESKGFVVELKDIIF